MHLSWHNYKYYPYERELALREVTTLLKPKAVDVDSTNIVVHGAKRPDLASRLVYFSDIATGSERKKTHQAALERVNGNGPGRQSTRYSAHGMHEYKGKFNPQVAKLLLNLFGVQPGHRVLDPFCGSGTSLVECAQLGISSVGLDINPLAVFIANSKLLALRTPAHQLAADLDTVLSLASKCEPRFSESARTTYLQSWFPPQHLHDVECIRMAIELSAPPCAEILLSIASNLLRDYSLQEPADLRIRRRSSPLPKTNFLAAFEKAVRAFTVKLEDSQRVLGVVSHDSKAVLTDSRCTARFGVKFHAALTSPPYATALPYIDTQRLSIVWLSLAEPSDLAALDADLVGSREIRGKSKEALLQALYHNAANLPEEELELCVKLQESLVAGDGFRRQQVPRLLYRYFAEMKQTFSSVRKLMREGAPFGLIVGGNHTVIGGRRFDIDTPMHLANISAAVGWKVNEVTRLQTYKRFGLHASNATTTEALLVITASQ